MVEVKITGLAEMAAMMRSLPDALQQRVFRGAMATGAAVIKNEAIELAPVYTGEVAAGHPPPGTLKRAIYQTRLTSQCTATREVWLIGVKRGKKARTSGKNYSEAGPQQVNQDAYYASWVEFGHYTRAPKGIAATQFARRLVISSGSQLVKGAHYVTPRPFMRPAFENKKVEAVNAVRQYLADNLPEAINSAKAKGK